MVALLPAPQKPQPEDVENQALFPFLRRCTPAAGIATPGIVTTALATAARSQEMLLPAPPLSKRQRRWFSLAVGLTHGVAIGLGLWLPSLWKQRPAAMPVASVRQSTTEQDTQATLWQALGSQDLADTLLTAKEQQINERLAAAEQSELQAQQLRITAEENAQNLTADAENRARQTTVTAIRQANLIQLDSTFIGAEQIIQGNSGDEVTLKFAARIQCQEGAFGETAIATPADARIASREIRNLADCYPSANTAAGEPVGEIGEWPVAFLKRAPD